MSIMLHLLWVVGFLLLWLLATSFAHKLPSVQLFVYIFEGVRGSLLALTICSFLAVVLGHVVGANAVGSNPDATNFFFTIFMIGLGMIAVPVGFLLGVAKVRHYYETAAADDTPQK